VGIDLRAPGAVGERPEAGADPAPTSLARLAPTAEARPPSEPTSAAVLPTAAVLSAPRPTATPVPVTPAPQASRPPAAESVTAEGWWVQVGAYSAREAAEQVRETLRVADLPAVVQSASVQGRPVHRVRIGPYPAAAQAESAQARAVLLGHAQATVFRQ
jgi:cell division protein FtsN